MKLVTWQAILNFLLYFGIGGAMLAVFTILYVRMTPFNEFEEILHRHRIGPAITLGCAMVGFALPIMSASLHGVSLLDFILWGVMAGIFQAIVFFVWYTVVAKNGIWDEIIQDRNNAAALLYGFFSIVVGLLNATSLVP